MLEISAGAVVFTLINHDLKYVIIHDNNGNYGFPKGHQEKGETLNETAIREIKEEIGIDIELLDDFKKEIFYTLPSGNNKQAIYFLATYNNQELKPQEGENTDKDYALFDVIRKRFSEPNSGDSFKYLPTQYLGEIIKQMEFDGIRFNSSLKKGGINIVLFDDKKCKATRSDIIKVSNIELKLDNPDIYQLEELFDFGSIKED